MDVSAVGAVGDHDPYGATWLSPVVQSAAMAAAFAGTNPQVVAHAPALARALQNTVPADDRVPDVPTIGAEVDQLL